MLEAHDDVRFVGEAGDMRTGAALLKAVEPQLLFLDVTLPDGEGPALLRALEPEDRPLIIFLTARADHAVPAFELEAIDYLLKPVGQVELGRALDRARSRLTPPTSGNGSAPEDTHIPVRNGRRTDLIPIETIDYVDVAGHYLCLHVGRDIHLLRESLSLLADKLESAGFMRCHRSAIVRLAAIDAIVDRRNGDGAIQLRGGATVPLSRTYREALDVRLAVFKR